MPPRDDPFAVLGLPEQYPVPADAVDAAYRARVRDVHPDTAGPAAAGAAARLNAAARTLKDPVATAHWLLEARVPGYAAERSKSRRVDPADAERWFEIQDDIAAFRAAPAAPGARATIERRRRDAHAAFAAGTAQVTAALAAYGAAPEAARPTALHTLRSTVEQLSYEKTLVADLDAALEQDL